ncbi:TetR/AcrR family transcriptional regulator [Leifsonia poae]|uniref:TetR/AcrR family transcriptional regulator n=1 Tax=Leifsonia poae TaxID=110933 RepID=UPI001CC098CA|nr:TetR/AcrR family transcriptional regulator [Leifsonia poae]
MLDAMVTASPATPPSRRERPAKPALSRQTIIDAATVILREEGAQKVTMRRVARALDTGHASLYVYVRDTEDLHAGILDAELAAIDTRASREGAGDWTDRLKDVLRQFTTVLFEHPEIARMAVTTRPNGPHYVALVETVLDLLVQGGASDRAAAWGVDVLLLYPVAIAAEHSAAYAEAGGEPRRPENVELDRQFAGVEAASHPQIARLAHELSSGVGPDRYEWALDVLIAGITTAGSRA